MKVLVTGGAGFIGSNLVDKLATEENDVIILDNLSSGSIANLRDSYSKSNVKFVRGDITRVSLVRRLVKGVDCVVHLAAITSVDLSTKDPLNTVRTNVGGTVSMLEACVKNGVAKFLFASSCSVYGDAKQLPTSENAPVRPRSVYSASKLSAESFIQSYAETYGLKTVCVRLFNVYGPRQGQSEYANVISRFIRSLTRSERPIIYGDGRQARDFLHVDDVVDVFEKLLASEFSSNLYNLGSGKSTTIKHLLEILSHIFGKSEIEPLFKATRRGDVRNSLANIAKIVSETGFRPKRKLEDELGTLVTNSKRREPSHAVRRRSSRNIRLAKETPN